MFRKVAIAGIGLIGGSIALSLKNKLPSVNVVGITRNPLSLPRTDNLKCFDIITNYDDLDAIKDVEVCVISTVVSVIPSTFRIIKNFVSPDALITDVGSVKEWVVKEINDGMFIGSHPLAGSEKSGIENASPHLLDGAVCVITPSGNSKKQIEVISNFWETLKMKVVILSPEIHDKIVAETSHLIHLVSFALSKHLSISEFSSDIFYGIFGKGLIDTTRIAKSDPSLWVEILQKNKTNLINSLSEFIKLLSKVKELISSDNWDILKLLLEDASNFRKKLD